MILTVAILLLLGIGWTARNMVPQFIEQIKLLLNIGPVRLGEWVLVGGLPYQVESISAFAHLNNPRLTGGELRLPLKDLIGMRSLACSEHETWFPTAEGDWVLINGSTWRQVAVQTPEYVRLSNASRRRIRLSGTCRRSLDRRLYRRRVFDQVSGLAAHRSGGRFALQQY